MLSDAFLETAALSSSASLHEAGKKVGALPSVLKPLAVHQKVCGRALPVACPAGDNLFLHHAIYAAQPGDVLVVDTAGGKEFGYWGEIMADASQVRGIAGLVITGGVRDSARMIEMGFPVFSERVCIRGTAKDPKGRGQIGAPVTIGGITIRRGDLVFGDCDGVVILPQDRAVEIVALANRRDREEADIIARLRSGETSLSIYNLPDIAPETPPFDGSRRSVEVTALGHAGLPIPAASRVGQMVATGGVRGVDPLTGAMPSSAQDQANLMFANLRTVVEAGGASMSSVVKITIWIAGPDVRAAINDPWLSHFPDPAARPARHILVYDLPGGMLVQCEALALVDA